MKPLADERATLQATLSRVLTFCTGAAGLVGLLGVALMLVRGGAGTVSFGSYTPADDRLRHAAQIARSALAGEALAVMQCAVVLLIATPVLRVVAAMVVFLIERDLLYVVLSLLVLAGLAVGFAGLVE